jgi:hypothetical protein
MHLCAPWGAFYILLSHVCPGVQDEMGQVMQLY